MSVEKFNPPTLHEPEGYLHVGIAQGSRLVFLAGQVAYDKERTLVGEGDLAAQTVQAIRNVHAALEAGGATFDDVAKITLYIVDWHEDKTEQLIGGLGTAAAELGIAPIAPATLVPVPRLAYPGVLIEVDVTAVVD